MAREDKPLEYGRRIRDTKGVAQRLDLNYLKRPAFLVMLRKRLAWLLAACAALAAVPLVMGVGGSRRVVANGPVSAAHAIFDDRCESCHTVAFGGTPDTACRQCHDGPPHPAVALDRARPTASPTCAQCHAEHQGKAMLREVSNGNCTGCHANLAAHASGVKLAGVRITDFRTGAHPEFSTTAMKDLRPLRLNHAIHMPKEPKVIRGIKLPMKCNDCHVTDRSSPVGALLPVTFEQNCKSCHARELEFDVYHVLPAGAPPAPHTKDARTIHEYVAAAYRGVRAPASAIKDSEDYLFGRKCGYCHVMAGYGEVRKVSPIAGRWLPRGEFSHRAHRAVECESCHTAARASAKTEDVLIPSMRTCLPCHGQSRAGLDRCSECHLYHNKSLEQEPPRREPGRIAPV
jgi:predicted CXXCH cytochrome family protein